MTQLPKLLPVVLTAVQLPILLVVPVGQVVTAHRTPERTKAGPGLGHVLPVETRLTPLIVLLLFFQD